MSEQSIMKMIKQFYFIILFSNWQCIVLRSQLY